MSNIVTFICVVSGLLLMAVAGMCEDVSGLRFDMNYGMAGVGIKVDGVRADIESLRLEIRSLGATSSKLLFWVRLVSICVLVWAACQLVGGVVIGRRDT